MEEDKEKSFWEELGKIFLIILIICSLFEVGLLIYAWTNADKVECNLIWCTFTSEDSYVIKSVNQECFVNDKPVNCSEIAKEIDWFHKEWIE